MKHRRFYMLFTALLGFHTIQAGELAEKAGITVKKQATGGKIKSLLKKGAKKGLKFIPGGDAIGSALGMGDLEEKVDRIEEKQETGLDKMRDIAKKAMQTKAKVEEMYYFKKQSQRSAEELVAGLKQGKKRNLLGAMVENWVGVPINPAAYIPDTAHTRKLRKNLDLDLSLERGLMQRGDCFLRDTRAALVENGLYERNPKQFNKEYEKALSYEQGLEKALAAKEQATIKLYKEDIENLEKEISILEKAKNKKGLTVGDVMQMELAIDNKRHIIRELNEKITNGLKEGMKLTDEQKATLGNQKIQQDTEALADFLEKDRARIHEKYSRLWKFW